MDDPEHVYHSLEVFSTSKCKEVPKELEEYIAYVAKTGDPVFPWSLVKVLLKEKFLVVLDEFREENPSLEIPDCPNVEPFNYEDMKSDLLNKLDSFISAPFTIQRICELLSDPRREYNRIDKYMRAVEKNVMVVTTRDTWVKRASEPEYSSSESVLSGTLYIRQNSFILNGDSDEEEPDEKQDETVWPEISDDDMKSNEISNNVDDSDEVEKTDVGNGSMETSGSEIDQSSTSYEITEQDAMINVIDQATSADKGDESNEDTESEVSECNVTRSIVHTETRTFKDDVLVMECEIEDYLVTKNESSSITETVEENVTETEGNKTDLTDNSHTDEMSQELTEEAKEEMCAEEGSLAENSNVEEEPEEPEVSGIASELSPKSPEQVGLQADVVFSLQFENVIVGSTQPGPDVVITSEEDGSCSAKLEETPDTADTNISREDESVNSEELQNSNIHDSEVEAAKLCQQNENEPSSTSDNVEDEVSDAVSDEKTQPIITTDTSSS